MCCQVDDAMQPTFFGGAGLSNTRTLQVPWKKLVMGSLGKSHEDTVKQRPLGGEHSHHVSSNLEIQQVVP